MSVLVEIQEEFGIVHLGELDLAEHGNELRELLDQALNTDGVRNVVIDFTGAKYCSSSVINDLLWARKRLAKKEGELRLCALPDHVREKLHFLSLDRVFEMFDSLGEALAGGRQSEAGDEEQ